MSVDATYFDRLAKSFSAVGTRRGIMQILASLPLVGGLGELGGTEEAAAKGRRKRRKKRHKHRENRRHQHRKGKRKGRDKGDAKCTKAGQPKTKGHPCCQGLVEEGGVCVQPSGCTPRTCPGGVCGTQPDGCGGTLSCGCATNQLCVDGACQTCTVSCPSGDPVTCGQALQGAITNAASGATLYVCPGRYQPLPSGTFGDQTGFFITGAGRTLTIIGAGQGDNAASDTILDANAAFDPPERRNRVMTVAFRVAAVTLRGLRLTGGAVQDTANTGANGGGIFNFGDTLRMTDCAIIANAAVDGGGGIFNLPERTLLLTGCIVADNAETGGLSAGGGGIYTAGPTTLTDCTLRGNTTAGEGGGIAISSVGHTITLDATVVGPGNNATGRIGGGGIFHNSGTLDLINGSQVTGNHHAVANGGGGIFNNQAFLTISADSSVTGNTAGPGNPPAPNNCAGKPPDSGTCGT
jgi:hypothetical protein